MRNDGFFRVLTPAFVARYESCPGSAVLARAAVVNFARVVGCHGDVLADIQLAVGEAVANAVEHGLRESATTFEVRTFVEDGALVVEVHDDGRGFDSSHGPRQSDWRNGGERGFGTSIMRAVMDRIEFKFGGTCVRLVKRLPAAERLASEIES